MVGDSTSDDRECAFYGGSEDIAGSVVDFGGDLDGDGSSESVKATLDAKLKEVLGKMSVTVVSGDGQKGVKNEPLAAPLVGKVWYNNSTPVKNANIHFSFLIFCLR